MNIKNLMVLNSVVAIIFGVLFVIIPGETLSWYGVEAGMQINLMSQLFGAALIGIGLVTWNAKNSDDSIARKAIIFSLFIADLIGFIVSLIAQLNNVVNALGWTTVIIYILLAIGFGYCHFSKSSDKSE